MLANAEIPVRVTDPRDVEIVLKPKWQIQIGPVIQLIEDYSIINPLDPHFASVAVIEQLAATFLDFGHANRANTKQCFRSREIDTRFLLFRLDLQQDNAFWKRIGANRAPQQLEIRFVSDYAECCC